MMVDYSSMPVLSPNIDVGFDASEPDPLVGI